MKKSIILKALFISLILVSCKKQSKELTTVNFHLYNPISNVPHAGVRVEIAYFKMTNFNTERKVIWEGVTDANGKVSHSFKAANNEKYVYEYQLDYNFFYNANMETISSPIILLKKNEVNNIDYLSVNKIKYTSWIKNVNCVDSTDHCRIKIREYDFKLDDWGEWGMYSSNLNGCFEQILSKIPSHQNILQYQMEVTRNNVMETTTQTYHMTGENGIDTLKIFY